MKNIQIVGLFNSGTNLMYNIINTLFDVNIGNEGHTHFWKHSVIGPDFAKKYISKLNNTHYIIITKNPYFQFHSFKKAPYSIKLKNYSKKTNLSIDEFVTKSFFMILPKNVITDTTNLSFKNFPVYWNRFHNSAFKQLPSNTTIHVKYEDLIFDPQSIIDTLTSTFPLKDEFTDRKLLNDALMKILESPSKNSGKPRFGNAAKEYYDSNNIISLYKPSTFTWMKKELDHDLMRRLNYQLIA